MQTKISDSRSTKSTKSMTSISVIEAMSILGDMQVTEKLDLKHSIVTKGICSLNGAVAVYFSASGESALMLL